MAAAWLIFVLLLVGFAVGVVGTASVTWFQRRRQRRLDMYYRARNATKAVGEMPDVEGLIKSASMRDTDEEAPVEVQRTSAPGPLHTGSKGCVNVSIDGYDALLRSTRGSRGFSLSQAEEVGPVYDEELSEAVGPINDGGMGEEGDPVDAEDRGTAEEVDDAPDEKEEEEDPDTPWIPSNPNRLFADEIPDGIAKSEIKEGTEGTETSALRTTLTPARRTPIGANVEPSGLDASARDIITNPDGRDREARARSSFDPPFEKMARASLGVGVANTDAVADNADDSKTDVEESGVRLKSSPAKNVGLSPLRNNPFATQLAEDERDLIKAEIQARW